VVERRHRLASISLMIAPRDRPAPFLASGEILQRAAEDLLAYRAG
jgi:hypothetical protein